MLKNPLKRGFLLPKFRRDNTKRQNNAGMVCLSQ